MHVFASNLGQTPCRYILPALFDSALCNLTACVSRYLACLRICTTCFLFICGLDALINQTTSCTRLALTAASLVRQMPKLFILSPVIPSCFLSNHHHPSFTLQHDMPSSRSSPSSPPAFVEFAHTQTTNAVRVENIPEDCEPLVPL